MYEDLLFYFYKVSKGLIESLNWEFPKICALEVFWKAISDLGVQGSVMSFPGLSACLYNSTIQFFITVAL